MENKDITTRAWPDYELLDSGGNRKLERYGKVIMIRPETQALWEPSNPALWTRANAEFRFAGAKGAWKKKGIPEEWEMGWKDARFTVRLTSFKHVGVFPEQAANWEWLAARVDELCKNKKGAGSEAAPQVLNLFGYTGIASIVAAQHGARVTHVDASKQSNNWAKDNARLSGVPAEQIRVLLDDAVKFAEREVRRGAAYEGIILDPPAFGRGPDGEVWHIEEHLPRLMKALVHISVDRPGAFFLLNGYAAGYSARSFLQVIEGFWKHPKGEFGELEVEETGTGRCVPSGIYARFVR